MQGKKAGSWREAGKSSLDIHGCKQNKFVAGANPWLVLVGLAGWVKGVEGLGSLAPHEPLFFSFICGAELSTSHISHLSNKTHQGMVDGEQTSTTLTNVSGFVSEGDLDVALLNFYNLCTSCGPSDFTAGLTNEGHTLNIRRYLQPTTEVDSGVDDNSHASDDQDELSVEIDEVLNFSVALRLLFSDE